MLAFAAQLKKHREAQGLSQDALANQLFVSRQAVSKWEQGDATPDLNNLVKLADILNVNLDTLVRGTEPASSDHDQFTVNPTTGLSTRRYGQMNGWDFLARFWWAIFGLVGMIGWILIQVLH